VPTGYCQSPHQHAEGYQRRQDEDHAPAARPADRATIRWPLNGRCGGRHVRHGCLWPIGCVRCRRILDSVTGAARIHSSSRMGGNLSSPDFIALADIAWAARGSSGERQHCLSPGPDAAAQSDRLCWWAILGLNQ
jgi:hypothetical protein